jgi:DNA-binding response OmpR family regulator
LSKILLVEDGLEFQAMVRASLEPKYRVTVAGTLAEARAKSALEVFDLFILDVSLPDGEGFSFCEDLRKNERTQAAPVIFLSVRSQITDKLHGFATGADDYLVKPFDALELKARVDAKILRRGATSPTIADAGLTKGPINMEAATGRAYLTEGGKKNDLSLTPFEFKILYHLARHEEKVVSREELLSTVWGQDTHVFDRATDKHVSSLRQKLGNHSKCIETVSRVGYRFVLQTARPRV